MSARRAGVTLVEAMVAIGILAVVSALVWGGFSQTSRNKQRMERALDHYLVVTSALDRMQRELSMAYVSAHVNGNPSLQVMNTAFVGKDRGGGDRIDFTSFAHRRLFRNARESDQCEISYFVARHPDRNDVRVLARREDQRIDDDPRAGGVVQILVENVEDFQVEYLDPSTGEWVDTWDTTQAIGQPNRLPTQVKLSLTVTDWIDASREQTFATRAALPITWGLNHAAYRAR
jgi:general secretion pathway protein J